jgi:putative transposase
VDFVYDPLPDSHPFRILAVVDQYRRPSPASEPRHSSGGADDAAVLDHVIAGGGASVSIVVGHGTAMTSRALGDWAYRRGPCGRGTSIHSTTSSESNARRSCA